MRSIVHHISMALFQRALLLSEFPISKHIIGLGMSDWNGYSSGFERVFSYRNTFIHKEPYLDITSPLSENEVGGLDFVVCSEVFEHIMPPTSIAYRNLWKLLKPGGLLVFTVPYSSRGATLEHFPGLITGKLVHLDEDWVFVYRRADGQTNVATNLIFHGGPGEVLEMREFALPDVVDELESAGFCEVRLQPGDYQRFGIINQHSNGLPIIAWKPLQ